MNKEKIGIPKLRFPGFTDPWEQRKLGDLAERTFGGGTPKTSVEEYWNGDLPWIQSSDLILGDVLHEYSKKKISEEAIRNSAAKKIPAKSIAIVTRVGVGKLAFVDKAFSTSQDFLTLADLNGNINFTLYLLFNLLKKEGNKTQGTSIKGITKSELLARNISVPLNLNEQQKIGSFFKQLDSLIALHQRKLEHLKQQKNGLLQKMFPKNGESVPEVRFPGFTDSWEQRKLGEVVEKSTIKNSDLEYSKEDILSVATMSDMSFSRNINSTENYMKTYNKILYGEIAFEGHSNKKYRFGRFVLNDYRNGIVSHIYDIYKIIIDYDMNFMKEWISLDRVMYRPLVNSTTSARMMNSLQAKKLYKQKVLLPDLQEQKEIGNFLNKFDTLIALHQRKLEHLELLKKGLLQQMFV